MERTDSYCFLCVTFVTAQFIPVFLIEGNAGDCDRHYVLRVVTVTDTVGNGW